MVNKKQAGKVNRKTKHLSAGTTHEMKWQRKKFEKSKK